MTDTTVTVPGPTWTVLPNAVTAAVQAAGWGWEVSDELPLTPEQTMIPILTAAAPLILAQALAAVLDLHHPICGRCREEICECLPQIPDRERWECSSCQDRHDEGVAWPCPTASALGVDS